MFLFLSVWFEWHILKRTTCLTINFVEKIWGNRRALIEAKPTGDRRENEREYSWEDLTTAFVLSLVSLTCTGSCAEALHLTSRIGVSLVEPDILTPQLLSCMKCCPWHPSSKWLWRMVCRHAVAPQSEVLWAPHQQSRPPSSPYKAARQQRPVESVILQSMS